MYVLMLADQLQGGLGCCRVIGSLLSDGGALQPGVRIGVYNYVIEAVITHGKPVQADRLIEHVLCVDCDLIDRSLLCLRQDRCDMWIVIHKKAGGPLRAEFILLTVSGHVTACRVAAQLRVTGVEFDVLALFGVQALIVISHALSCLISRLRGANIPLTSLLLNNR